MLSSNEIIARSVESRRARGERGSATVTPIFAGQGWRLVDIVCNCDAGDAPFEEQHDYVSIALVLAGAFTYRSRAGCGSLCSGSLLLGARHTPFTCTHEHGVGDRCVALQFAAECYEELLALLNVRGGGMTFPRVVVPVSTDSAALFTRAEAFAGGHIGGSAHELALGIVSWVTAKLGHCQQEAAPTPAQTQAMLAVARAIDEDVSADHSLSTLCSRAAMTPFHFIRCFKRVVGTTPHTYVRIARVRQAARLLCDARRPSIASVAFQVGFQDLSAFNHAFRQVCGSTPRQLRASVGIWNRNV